MEGSVFRSPAVAGLMKENLVESRQHVDIQKGLTLEQFEANKRTRTEVAGDTIATPYFVIVDPKTGATLGAHALSGGPTAWEGNWLEFLHSTFRAAGRE
ncbi:MAG: hypothetical protein U1E73_01030 [Planctomycetota bacterium]